MTYCITSLLQTTPGGLSSILPQPQCAVLLSVSRSFKVRHAFAGLITHTFHSETLWLTVSAATVTWKRCRFPPKSIHLSITKCMCHSHNCPSQQQPFFAGNGRVFQVERLCHTKSILTRVRFINSTCNYRQFLVNRAIMKKVYWTEKKKLTELVREKRRLGHFPVLILQRHQKTVIFRPCKLS